MRYEDIPNVNAWKVDAYSLHQFPIDPIVVNIGDMLTKYYQAFSPMAKRNLLADLEKSCLAWKPPKPGNAAMDALLEVVKRRLAYSSGSIGHVYDNVVCVSYSVTTGEFVPGTDVVVYRGKLDDEQDMRQRVNNMKTAFNQARNFVPNPARDDSKTLKIFMAPEFYFRGRYGAYPPEIVAQILPLLRDGSNGSDSPVFKDWLFIFGTAISASIDARHHCYTCKSAQHIVFKRDPLDRSKTIVECSKGATHNVQEGIFGATIDNVALIQKGKQDYLVAKEYMSGIDFRNPGSGAYVKMMNAGVRDEFKPIATEGSVVSRFASKFDDERMGGGVFNIDGITFGMEICLDHEENKLAGVGNLQILLIPSAGMDIKRVRTISNGVTFNVDGQRENGKVYVSSVPGVWKTARPFALSGVPGNIEIFDSLMIPYI